MEQLSAPDALRYERIKKELSSGELGFRASAHRSAEHYDRPLRQLLNHVDTKDVPVYELLSDWSVLVVPEIEALQPASKSTTLRSALAKQLRLSNTEATSLADRLVEERVSLLRNTFLDHRYSSTEKARAAANELLSLSTGEVADIRSRFVAYELYRLVAKESGIIFYDAHASRLQRLYQRVTEHRQVKRYQKRQARRLVTILARQQELKSFSQAIISRILLLELDTVLALDAYRKYKNQLDKLKPENVTSAKRLSLFAAATKKIREAHTAKQSTTAKLADLQGALKAIDDVLVELFDMTDAQRNVLMTNLKEYRDLEREASRITKEQAMHAN